MVINIGLTNNFLQNNRRICNYLRINRLVGLLEK